jgi:hypothetical protein
VVEMLLVLLNIVPSKEWLNSRMSESTLQKSINVVSPIYKFPDSVLSEMF